MKTVIDALDSTAGWSGPAGAEFTLNQVPGFMSDYLQSSLLIHVPAGSAGKSFTKSVSVPLGSADEIVLSVWSRNLKRVNVRQPSDYFYRVTFDGSHWFMLPTNVNFETDVFGVNGWSAVTQITVVPTTDREDWLLLSGCYAVREEMPLDVLQAVVDGINHYALSMMPSGVPLAPTVTCAQGDEVLTLSSDDYLDRGAVLAVLDGGNTEYHQVGHRDGLTVSFTDRYDGRAMKHAHSGAAVSLWLQASLGSREIEAVVPGISVWGMAPRSSQDVQDTYEVEDSIGPDGAASLRRAPWMQEYEVIVDCEARTAGILALLSRVARRFLSSSRIWINGMANELPYPEPAVYVEPEESAVMIPKLQFKVMVEVHEERDSRRWASAAEVATTSFNPVDAVQAVEP